MTDVAAAPSIGTDHEEPGNSGGQIAPRDLYRPTPNGQIRLSVVVPTRNEAENIPVLLSRLGPALKPLGAEIIVVDDSDDETAAVLAR
ncbi:MAG: glycosyltransferase, partial [Micromonospora sp.]